ncbi:hypothetical protein K2X92_00135 [Candidatus Gracilibacteria bacterium]|nr:hypothetical protein [Candidatus Gracilibacteria bacterium]
MQKTIKKTTDFFTSYRANQLRKTFVSGGIAVFAAFSIVSVIHGDVSMEGLMASVENVTETPRLEADIIMKRSGNSLSLVFGAKGKKIDQIQFTLLGDPTKFRSISNSNPDITILDQKDMGTYHVQVNFDGRDVAVGTVIADLIIDSDSNSPIAITDTEFVSGGQRYALTSKGE